MADFIVGLLEIVGYVVMIGGSFVFLLAFFYAMDH
jgi:hypothetical protein